MSVTNSIRNKFMVPTLVFTVLLLSLLGILLAMNSFFSMKMMLTAKADSTADFIAKVSINSYKNFEYSDLDNLVREIKKDPEVNFAVFYDANDGPLTKELDKSQPPYIAVERNLVDEKGAKLGSLKIGFNRSMLDANLQKSLLIISCSFIAAILTLLFGMRSLSERIVIRRILAIEALSKKLADGDLTVVFEGAGSDEIDVLGRTMNKMAATLKNLIGETRSRNSELEEWQRNELWFKGGVNDLNDILREDQTNSALADRTLTFLIGYLRAGVGVFYQYLDEDESLQAVATYALAESGRLKERIHPGEGLAGQVALERKLICISAVPHNYLPISSALGAADPLDIILVPILHNDNLTGVLEIGAFKQFTANEIRFLQQAAELIAIAMNANHSRQLVNELLEQTQSQAEELRVQQEELQQTNEELTERARLLAAERKIASGNSSGNRLEET